MNMTLNKYNKAPPRISVITVVFNSDKLIRKTIESVLFQSYDNVEFIIIDGASTDGTLEIIKEYDNYVDKWHSEDDNGIYDAMNKGINTASGEYLMFLNAGDIFSNKDVLSLVAGDIVLNGYPEILYGETNVLNENGLFLKKLEPLLFSRLNLSLFGTRTVCHQSIFVKREFAPLYDLSYKLKGELCWYYDLLGKNRKLNAVRLSYPISNYLLGGVGDVLFKQNLWERLRIVVRKDGVLGSFMVIPFFIIPIVFRLKRKLLDRMFFNK